MKRLCMTMGIRRKTNTYPTLGMEERCKQALYRKTGKIAAVAAGVLVVLGGAAAGSVALYRCHQNKGGRRW